MTQNKQAEKEFFDNFVEKGEYDVFDEKGTLRILNELQKLTRISSQRPVRMLDVGCGTGAFTRRFAQINNEVFGVDISHKSALLAQKVAPECFFLTGDAEFLPFKRNSLDVVLFSGVLHHLPSMEEALAECYHALKPGGSFVAFDPNGKNPAMWLYRSKSSPLATRKGWTENEHLLVKDDILRALTVTGFEKVIVKGISGISYQYVGSKMAMKVLGIYNIFDSVLDKVGLANTFGSFLISHGVKPQ